MKDEYDFWSATRGKFYQRGDMTRISCEMYSTGPDDAIKPFPNILRIYNEGRLVYVEIEAVHDGHKVVSTVVVERAVFAYHMKASGVMS